MSHTVTIQDLKHLPHLFTGRRCRSIANDKSRCVKGTPAAGHVTHKKKPWDAQWNQNYVTQGRPALGKRKKLRRPKPSEWRKELARVGRDSKTKSRAIIGYFAVKKEYGLI